MKKKRFLWGKFLRFCFFLFLSFFTFIYTIKELDKINYDVDDSVTVSLISGSNSYQSYSLLEKFVHLVLELDLVSPSKLISNSSSMFLEANSFLEDEFVIEIEKETIKEEENNMLEKKEPIIYIYNTHQREKYQSGSNNLTPSVLGAAKLLKNEFEKLGILSVVELTDVTEILNVNSWNYASSYKVTRMLLEQSRKDYKKLEYYIDLHRDSVSKTISTVKINGENYARILFVLGLENENYNKNLAFMERLEKIFNKEYPGLSRGIYKKQGAGVNGVYNQDFDPNCILLEVGGEKNTMDEVENTIRAIAFVFNKYLKEVK